MSDYNIFPAVNRDLEFPPGIRAKLAQAEEMKKTYAHLEDGKLVIDGKVVAASGSGSGTGVTYSDATAADKGVVKLAVANDVSVGTSGATVVNAALLKQLLAAKASVAGSVKGVWGGTQAEYDAVTKEANWLYFVVSAGS